MVGEIRDGETAKIAIEAALTGHFVLSTLHTNDAPSALTRLIDMGVEPFLTGTALRRCWRSGSRGGSARIAARCTRRRRGVDPGRGRRRSSADRRDGLLSQARLPPLQPDRLPRPDRFFQLLTMYEELETLAVREGLARRDRAVPRWRTACGAVGRRAREGRGRAHRRSKSSRGSGPCGRLRLRLRALASGPLRGSARGRRTGTALGSRRCAAARRARASRRPRRPRIARALRGRCRGSCPRGARGGARRRSRSGASCRAGSRRRETARSGCARAFRRGSPRACSPRARRREHRRGRDRSWSGRCSRARQAPGGQSPARGEVETTHASITTAAIWAASARACSIPRGASPRSSAGSPFTTPSTLSNDCPWRARAPTAPRRSYMSATGLSGV